MKFYLQNKKEFSKKIFLSAAFAFAIFVLLPVAHAEAASRYWVGGSSTWDATAGTKWALTSGGAGGQAVPTALDDVHLDNGTGTGNVTIGSGYTALALSLDCTGYVGTLSSTNATGGLTVAGSITFVSGMTVSATNLLTISAAGTLTGASKTWGGGLTYSTASVTYTTSGTISVSGALTLVNNGLWTGGTINVAGNLSSQTIGGTSTTSFVMNGTSGTSTFSSTTWRCPITFNSSNTIAVGSMTMSTGASVTYTAGTMSISGTLTLNSTMTLNTSGMTWNNIIFSGTSITYTLGSNLNASGIVTGSGTTATTITTAGFDINANGGFTSSVTNFTISGTGHLVLGGGTWSSTGTLTGNLSFAGNVTVSGSVVWRTGVMLYSSGTVTTSGSTLTVNSTSTFNVSGISWANVTLNGTSTMTLSSDLNVGGNLTLGGTTLTTTLTGAFNINVTGSVGVGTGGTTAIVTTSGSAPTIIMINTGTLTTTSSCQLRVPLKFNASGHTITISGTINYNTGTLTYQAGTMNVSGSTLNVAATTTLDTNSMHWNNVTVSGTSTITLLSDLNVDGTLTMGSTTLTTTFVGAFNINANADVTLAGTTAVVNDTGGLTTLNFVGSGTFTTPSSTQLRLNSNINTLGTLILSGTINFNNRNLTYTAGSVTATGSTLNLAGSSTSSLTVNHSGLALGAVLVATPATFNATFNGTNGFTMTSLTDTTVGNTITWGNGNTYTISNALTLTGTAASHITFNSDSSGNAAFVTLPNGGATQDVSFVDTTDINSSAGQTIQDFKGTLTRAINWLATGSTASITLAFTFVL